MFLLKTGKVLRLGRRNWGQTEQSAVWSDAGGVFKGFVYLQRELRVRVNNHGEEEKRMTDIGAID